LIYTANQFDLQRCHRGRPRDRPRQGNEPQISRIYTEGKKADVNLT